MEYIKEYIKKRERLGTSTSWDNEDIYRFLCLLKSYGLEDINKVLLAPLRSSQFKWKDQEREYNFTTMHWGYPGKEGEGEKGEYTESQIKHIVYEINNSYYGMVIWMKPLKNFPYPEDGEKKATLNVGHADYIFTKQLFSEKYGYRPLSKKGKDFLEWRSKVKPEFNIGDEVNFSYGESTIQGTIVDIDFHRLKYAVYSPLIDKQTLEDFEWVWSIREGGYDWSNCKWYNYKTDKYE